MPLDFDRYRGLLRVRSSKQVLAASFAVAIASSARTLALVLLVRQQTGSFALAGAAAGLAAAGGAVCAPLRGRLVDRFGQAPVILPMTLVHTAAWASVAGVAHTGAPRSLLLALSFIGGVSFPPIYACVRASWSCAFRQDPRLLESAYAMNSAVQNVAAIVGPLLAASVVALLSPALALVGTTLLTLSGALLLTASDLSRAVRATTVRQHRAGSVLRSRGLRALLLVMVMFGMSMGAIQVAVPATADEWSSALGAGALLACFAAGDIAGALGYGARAWRSPRARQLLLSFLVAGGIFALLLVVPEPALGVFLFAAGVSVSPILINEYHLLDDVAPAGTATESFTWVASGQLAGIALGASLAGEVVERFGPNLAFGVAASAAIGAAALLALEGDRLRLPVPVSSAAVAG